MTCALYRYRYLLQMPLKNGIRYSISWLTYCQHTPRCFVNGAVTVLHSTCVVWNWLYILLLESVIGVVNYLVINLPRVLIAAVQKQKKQTWLLTVGRITRRRSRLDPVAGTTSGSSVIWSTASQRKTWNSAGNRSVVHNFDIWFMDMVKIVYLCKWAGRWLTQGLTDMINTGLNSAEVDGDDDDDDERMNFNMA